MMASNDKPTQNTKNGESLENHSNQLAEAVHQSDEKDDEDIEVENSGLEESSPSPPVIPTKSGSSANLSAAATYGESANQRVRNIRQRSSPTLSLSSNPANGVNSNASVGYSREIQSGKARNQSAAHRRRRNDEDLGGDDIEGELEGAVGGAGDVGAEYQPVQPALNNHISGNGADAPERALQPGGIPYNWQANKRTLRERLAYIFNSECMADVHFLVGRGNQTQRIPAHKFVLSIGSAVFDAMFNGGMATTSSEVELPDVEPSAFIALLKFLYTDEVSIGPETVMTCLYTAKKYAVPALEKACVDFLKRNLSSDNAFMLLTQARLFDEPQLAVLCLETIDKNTCEALAAEGFTDIDLETLSVVLERDTLGIRECKLFGAVCRWAEAECVRQSLPVTSENQRGVLGRALQLIRFPLMTVEEFAMGSAQSGILSDREVVQLFLHFTVNPKPTVNFVDTPRCCLTGKEQVVSRFCQTESRWGYSGTSDRIRLVVSRRIFVVGFGLYGSIHGPAEYQVNIQLIHTDTGKICGQNDCSFQCDGSTSTFRVMFKEPVELQPNTSFTACATLKGPDSHYGTKGLRKVTHESLTSGKVTFQFTYAAGNNNGTSVEDGQLPEIIFYT